MIKKEYKILKFPRYFMIFAGFFLSLCGITLFIIMLINNKSAAELIFILLFTFAAIFQLIFVVLKVPHKIRLTDDNKVIFISALKKNMVLIDDIVNVKHGFNSCFIYLITKNGKKIRLYNSIVNQHDFLSEVLKPKNKCN